MLVISLFLLLQAFTLSVIKKSEVYTKFKNDATKSKLDKKIIPKKIILNNFNLLKCLINVNFQIKFKLLIGFAVKFFAIRLKQITEMIMKLQR